MAPAIRALPLTVCSCRMSALGIALLVGSLCHWRKLSPISGKISIASSTNIGAKSASSSSEIPFAVAITAVAVNAAAVAAIIGVFVKLGMSKLVVSLSTESVTEARIAAAFSALCKTFAAATVDLLGRSAQRLCNCFAALTASISVLGKLPAAKPCSDAVKRLVIIENWATSCASSARPDIIW